MAETIVAHITFLGGSTISYNGSSDNTGKEGGTAYALRKADGTHCGNYATCGAAKRAFESTMGKGTITRWTQENLRGDIEHWVGKVGR